MRGTGVLSAVILTLACGGESPPAPLDGAPNAAPDGPLAAPSEDSAAPDAAAPDAALDQAAPAEPDVAPDLAPPPPDTGAPDVVCLTCGPRVEEWGTYTSVQASDGHTLGGVHHEDERLPAWVHRRDWGPNSYFLEQLPEEPRQQLETPILYFWSPVARPVRVTVEFPRGVVGQWYPAAETFLPELRKMTELARGSMTWQLTLDPAISPASFPAVDPHEIWAPSRNVASTPVRWTSPDGAEEREQFIFYRGLGTFVPPIRVVARDGGRLEIANTAPEVPPAAFLLRVSGGRGRIVALGALGAGGPREALAPTADEPLDSYVDTARALLEKALVESGLSADVARAMVDTWARSWFTNPGLRLLYLAPRAWTDAWLPTTITPAPSSFVRTLVGRIEILTPEEERSLVALLKSRAATGPYLDITTLGRFAEPRLLRAVELLASDEPARLFAEQHAMTAHQAQ